MAGRRSARARQTAPSARRCARARRGRPSRPHHCAARRAVAGVRVADANARGCQVEKILIDALSSKDAGAEDEDRQLVRQRAREVRRSSVPGPLRRLLVRERGEGRAPAPAAPAGAGCSADQTRSYRRACVPFCAAAACPRLSRCLVLRWKRRYIRIARAPTQRTRKRPRRSSTTSRTTRSCARAFCPRRWMPTR